MKLLATLAAATLPAFAAAAPPPARPAPAWAVVDRIALGGDARWDLAALDPARHRLYVAHGSRVDAIDTATDRVVGSVPGVAHAHGIAVAGELGLGFASAGDDDELVVFDLATLATVRRVKVGANPDTVVYHAASRRVVVFDARSADAVVVDAVHGTVLATVALGAKPELALVAPDGRVWFNTEDTGELVEFDVAAMKVLARHKLAGCTAPSGLARDDRGRFYSACDNRVAVVSAADGAPLARVPIGANPDGAAWLDGVVLVPNGEDGTLSEIAETAPGRFETVATIPTAHGARTIAVDPAAHRVYLPAARWRRAGADGRPALVPGSTFVLVLQRVAAGR